MKKLEKKELFQVMGGACHMVWATLTTNCKWTDGKKKCSGDYELSGKTIFITCSDGYTNYGN